MFLIFLFRDLLLFSYIYTNVLVYLSIATMFEIIQFYMVLIGEFPSNFDICNMYHRILYSRFSLVVRKIKYRDNMYYDKKHIMTQLIRYEDARQLGRLVRPRRGFMLRYICLCSKPR